MHISYNHQTHKLNSSIHSKLDDPKFSTVTHEPFPSSQCSLPDHVKANILTTELNRTLTLTNITHLFKTKATTTYTALLKKPYNRSLLRRNLKKFLSKPKAAKKLQNRRLLFHHITQEADKQAYKQSFYSNLKKPFATT